MSPPTSSLNDAVDMVQRPLLRPDGACTHIMAIQFDSLRDPGPGVIRCIDSREGQVHVPGFVDRSQLRFVEMDSLYEAELGEVVDIEGSTEVISNLDEFGSREFLGYEDPIVWRTPEMDEVHLYCTIPFYEPEEDHSFLYLGHAKGANLRSLRMKEPVLGPEPGVHDGAKEPVIAPVSSASHRYNLVESTGMADGSNYSVLRTVIAEDPDGPWEYDDLAFHPVHDGHDWCAGHVSPGPLLPDTFVDVGAGKRVGFLNGREADRRIDGEIGFGTFTIGLMVYDYEEGSVEWVSEEPFIEDPSARTITFASAFRQTEENRGVVYAHVDDSFIRVYEIDAEALPAFLP